jgi:RNA polymerase sigma factor (sigma-70 family)
MFDVADKIKKKDSAAIALLYDRYGKKLFGYAISKWKVSEDDAWELVYKTLYKIIHASDNYVFEDENRFVGFLFRVFINYLRNHYRDSKNKIIETTELLEKHEKMSNDRIAAEDEKEKLSPLMECLQKVLGVLEDWQRIILLMRAQDYSYEAIAPYVNKPASQLKVYHLRLKKLVTEKTNDCVKNNSNEGE